MPYTEVNTQNILALNIIKSVLENSDDPKKLAISLTAQIRDLLGCKTTVFLQFVNAPVEYISYEVTASPESFLDEKKGSRLQQFVKDITKVEKVTFVEDLSPYSELIHDLKTATVVPFIKDKVLMGVLLLFDIMQLFDVKSTISTLETLSSYISIVLFNTISQEKLEQLIDVRTRELIQALEGIKKANDAKSAFLANMSHEMRTPLNGIMGYLNLLEDKEIDIKKLDYINKATNASHMLLALISDVLDFSKIESNRIQLDRSLYSLREAVHEVIGLVRPRAASKGIALEIEFAESVPRYVVGDSHRFIQILTNLVSNAIKFTAEGTVHIYLDAVEMGDKIKLICDVTDTGIGIRPENIDKIFEVFVQEDTSTTRKFGGTGLGLSITKNLVEHMGGKIQVDSEYGIGSIFSFYIFVEKTSKGSLAKLKRLQKNSLEDGVINSELKILVVEDNEINLELMNEILKMKNIIADNAKDGYEAIKKVRENKYDLVFMDCQMPVLDGFEATRQIRLLDSDHRRTKIIALTAGVLESDREKCYQAGMDDYLAKPINLEQIFAKLKSF